MTAQKITLVTGGNRGTGLATCRRLLAADASCVSGGCYRERRPPA